jgi:hypothetical protein
MTQPNQKAKVLNVGWISASASTKFPLSQGLVDTQQALVDALSLIHPTDELSLEAA